MKYVDLGLSVLWADRNMGAITPEEYGNYYKWDQIPKDYEIPTIEQYKELITNCDWKQTTQNGAKGYKVISKVNGNSIFLPAAGYRNSIDPSNIIFSNYQGYYWSSSPCEANILRSYYLIFNSGYVNWNNDYHFYRQPVRTIKSKINFKNKTTMTLKLKEVTLKEVNEIFPLKSGMCLELFKDNKTVNLILFQYGDGELGIINYARNYYWTKFTELDYSKSYETIKVYQSPTGINIFDEQDLIFNSDDYTVKELTMQEIADKFGIKVEQLRIKE